MTCPRRTPKNCCGCPVPVVILTPNGNDLDYVISNADSADLITQCNAGGVSSSPITLTGGGISDTYSPGMGNTCFVEISATNECGTTTERWRNYTIPKQCDCIITDLDPPALWGRVGDLITTISGTPTPVSLVISSSTICATPAASGNIEGSFLAPCGNSLVNQRYLITTHTGCSDYLYYIDMKFINSYLNWNNASPAYGVLVNLASGWFQKASNPYPSLTSVAFATALSTLLGATPNSRHTRDKYMERITAGVWAAPSTTMLECYLGTIEGSGGIYGNSFDNVTNPSSSNQGHYDLSGLAITADVL